MVSLFIIYLISTSEKVVVKVKVVLLFIANILVKVSNRYDVKKARKCLITGPRSKIDDKPIRAQLRPN